MQAGVRPHAERPDRRRPPDRRRRRPSAGRSRKPRRARALASRRRPRGRDRRARRGAARLDPHQARIEAVRAAHPGFEVSPAVIAYVARAITANGRDLEGAVNRLLAHATLTSAADHRGDRRDRDPRPRAQPGAEAGQDRGHPEAGGLPLQRLPLRHPVGAPHRRRGAPAPDRHVPVQGADLRSLPEIGRRFGGRDHTTVLHAVRKIEKAIGEDSALSDEVELLKRMLQE